MDAERSVDAARVVTDSPPPRRRAYRTVGGVLLVMGLGMGGAALGVDASGNSDRDTIRLLGCGDQFCEDDADRLAYSSALDAENRRLVAIGVLTGTGTVAAITGVVLIARAGKQQRPSGLAIQWTGTGASARIAW
jgi:hypothetical protein